MCILEAWRCSVTTRLFICQVTLTGVQVALLRLLQRRPLSDLRGTLLGRQRCRLALCEVPALPFKLRLYLHRH